MPYILIVLDGPDMGETHKLEVGVTMIGRMSSADSCDPTGFRRWELSDNTVSRTHCEISLSEIGPPILTHHSSTNQTFVNGEVVRDCFLEDGQCIFLGRTKIGVMFE